MRSLIREFHKNNICFQSRFSQLNLDERTLLYNVANYFLFFKVFLNLISILGILEKKTKQF